MESRYNVAKQLDSEQAMLLNDFIEREKKFF